MVLSDLIIDQNISLDNYSAGGLTCINNSILQLTQSNISANEQGGIYLLDSDATIQITEIRNNGGAGIILNNSVANIDETTVDGNHGTGILCWNASNVNIRNSKVCHNGKTQLDAGGISLWNNSNIILESIAIIGNIGRGLCCTRNSTASLTNTTIQENTQWGDYDSGAGIKVNDGSTLTIYSSVISGNETRGEFSSGGGIYALYNVNMTLEDVTVSDNASARSGGGISISEGVFGSFTNLQILGNYAAANGGGLRVGTTSTCTFVNVAIANNTAQGLGGGIYLSGSNVEFSDFTLFYNYAFNGGALYCGYNSDVLISNATISSNYAGNQVGGILNEVGSLTTIQHSNYVGNGYALFNEDNSVVLTATDNYWGDPTGPYHPTQNPTGQGDSVNAFVNITPFLNEPDTDAPPIPVQNFAVAGTGNDFVNICWDTSPLGDLAGYKIYYNSDSSGYPYANSLDVGTVTSYTLSGLSLITNQYFIAVTCYDMDGNESWYSFEAATSIIDIVPPASPQNLSAQAGDKQVTLTWTANAENDFLRYRIYGGTTANPATAIDSSESVLDTTRTISDLDNDTTYYFLITALDTAGNESGFSNDVSATPSDQTAPAAPQNLVAEAGDGQVTLVWAKSTESDFLRYRIYGDTTANPVKAIDSSESVLDTTRTISGLNNSITYYFRITAVDTALNESGFSNEVNATPTALAIEESSGIPASFALHPAYPNPFNPTTNIRFDLPEAVDISIVVYDLMGREISRLVDGHIDPGYHQVIWNGKDNAGREVPTGIYIARQVTPQYTKSIKMVLLK